jgi:hypothetical protein
MTKDIVTAPPASSLFSEAGAENKYGRLLTIGPPDNQTFFHVSDGGDTITFGSIRPIILKTSAVTEACLPMNPRRPG